MFLPNSQYTTCHVYFIFVTEFIEHPELIQAKVPILKFRDTCFCLEVDLNCNNSVGIRNTHLLSCYARSEFLFRD
jgi:poly(A) RNA polymerase GLD2